MGQKFFRIALRLSFVTAILAPTSCLIAQGAPLPPQAISAVNESQTEIPDSPAPQIELAVASNPQAVQAQNAQQPSAATAPASGSSAQSPQNSAQQLDTQESQRQKAAEEVEEEEHQRIARIVPAFNVTYHSDAVSLNPAQKFELQFHAAIDPYTFSIALIVAGLSEAGDTNSGFGWGPSGFAKRAGAAYGDNVIGHTFGNAILPSLLHQDPRYFSLGHGSIPHRFFYSIATAFICKHDNTGKWEPNYSNVLGNMIGGEISTLYYPKSKSNAAQAIDTGLTVTFEGAFGSVLQEIWPDISRKFFHRDPTHGLDAQQAAESRNNHKSGKPARQ